MSMKKLTFRRLVVVSSLFVMVSGLTAASFTLIVPSQASALTSAEQIECYTKFNGQEINFSRQDTATQTLYNTNCATMCTKEKLYDSAGSLRDEVKVTCVNPAALPEEVTKKTHDARLFPVWKLVCGDAPAGEAAIAVYQECTAKVETAYNKCNTTGGPATSAMEASSEDLGRCIRQELSSTLRVQQFIDAVTQGRSDAEKVLSDYFQTELEAETKTCKATQTLVNGECVDNSTTATCSGGALGWLLCPIVTIMDNLNQMMAKNIEGILKVDMMTNADSKKALQSIWAMLVGIANLLLVVAFLVVIFSQATSIGLSAYGIKKMLPRIIAAAILINLSFFICGMLIDVFNVIGGTVRTIIISGMKLVPDPSGAVSVNNLGVEIGSWILGLSATLVTLTASVVLGFTAFVVPVIIGGAMATLAFFIGIMLRLVLIVLLIVVAPVAIAAMILPNTESLFKKWWSSLIKLLALYPVIIAIMYGCALVAKIIMAGA